MFTTIKTFFKQFRFLRNGEIIVDASEYVSLNARKSVTPLSRSELTQHQLASYIPSFKPLADQKDDFKRGMATFCKQTSDSQYWKYLIEHMKQDQVNNLLFAESRPSEEWVRGSINGIYVVEEQIKLLGTIEEGNKTTP